MMIPIVLASLLAANFAPQATTPKPAPNDPYSTGKSAPPASAPGAPGAPAAPAAPGTRGATAPPAGGPDTGAPTGTAATPESVNRWPQQILSNGKQYTVFQPVVTGIDGSRAYLVTQVAMDSADGKQVTAKAQLVADIFPADLPGELEINNFRVNRLTVDNKPAAAADATALGQAIFVVAMTVDRATLVQNMRLMNARGSSTPGLRFDPPAIVTVNTPAVLLQVDGDPVVAPLGSTGWSFVRNTPFVLLRDKSNTWWTRVSGKWMTSKEMAGGYAPAAAPPGADVFVAMGTLPAPPSDIPAATRRIARPLAAGPVQVIVATKPTILVSIDGPAIMGKVAPGVMAVTNTNASLLSADNAATFYLLASGRWFTTGNPAAGPWNYCAPIDVPRAFTQLPRIKRWDGVRAALPGTPEANEASLAAREVRTVTVKRDAAQCAVTYAGAPDFKPVQDTQMKFAANASQPVIASQHAFFCCDAGVWFVSNAAQGPWKLAERLPAEIYSVPPACPVYPATYVEIFGSTEDSVTFGFSAGYLGTYLNDGTPVYGTGVDYGGSTAGGAFQAYPQTYGMDPQYDAQTGTFTPPDDPNDDYAYFGLPDVMPASFDGNGWGGFGWCAGWNRAWASGWNNWWGWDHWGWWMAHWHPYYARWQPAHHDWQQQTTRDAQARAAQRATPMDQRTWPAARGAMANAGSVQIRAAAGSTGAAAPAAKPAVDPAVQVAQENAAALAKQFQGAARDTPVSFRGPGDEYGGYAPVAYRPWTGNGTPLGGNWGYSPLSAPNGFHPTQQFATPGAYWGSGTAAGNNVGPNAGPYSTPQGHGGWGTYDHWAGEGLQNSQFTGYSNAGSP